MRFFRKDKNKQTGPEADSSIEDRGWLSRLKHGLEKSSARINDGLKDVFIRKRLDVAALEELEDVLISADLGVKLAADVTAALAKGKFDREVTEEDIRQTLASHITAILAPVAKKLVIGEGARPQVIIMCGVNGAGKTTTIGKLANRFKAEGKSVMIAACDTFRAAAVEQLEIWAERNHCPLVKGSLESDPASVAYTALERAREERVDILLIDTAGRLQNKQNLMEQLAKLMRVIKKVDETAPHHSIIVLDATTGQNAINQVRAFKEMTEISGMVITKLDGTAKGGVVVALAEQFGLPVHAIGVGEAVEDLHDFDAASFARSLTGKQA